MEKQKTEKNVLLMGEKFPYIDINVAENSIICEQCGLSMIECIYIEDRFYCDSFCFSLTRI